VLDRAELAKFWALTATSDLLPAAVRGGASVRVGPPARPAPRRRTIVVRMAFRAGDDRAREFVDVLHAALVPIGLDVRPVGVDDIGRALRNPRLRIELASLTTSIEYPDPASFLTRMLGRDVPAGWLAAPTRAAVAQLAQLTGGERDRAARDVANAVARDAAVVAYGTQELGTVVGRRLGCRVWNGVDPALDLAALCLR
jgi:hypothetical protein